MKKLSLIWSLIDDNIDDQLPKCQKNACNAYWYTSFLRKKVPVCHTGPYRPTSTLVVSGLVA